MPWFDRLEKVVVAAEHPRDTSRAEPTKVTSAGRRLMSVKRLKIEDTRLIVLLVLRLECGKSAVTSIVCPAAWKREACSYSRP